MMITTAATGRDAAWFAIGIPAVAAGTASPTTTGLTAGFAVIVVARSAALLAILGGPGGHR